MGGCGCLAEARDGLALAVELAGEGYAAIADRSPFDASHVDVACQDGIGRGVDLVDVCGEPLELCECAKLDVAVGIRSQP